MWPGSLPFHTRIATSADTGVVPGNVLRTFVPKLLGEGYRLSTHSETKLVLEESHRLVWNHLLSVFRLDSSRGSARRSRRS